MSDYGGYDCEILTTLLLFNDSYKSLIYILDHYANSRFPNNPRRLPILNPMLIQPIVKSTENAAQAQRSSSSVQSDRNDITNLPTVDRISTDTAYIHRFASAAEQSVPEKTAPFHRGRFHVKQKCLERSPVVAVLNQ